MKINDVERQTGLSQKAIRLYEAKGLLRVARRENGYRDYSEEDVTVLRQIKLLREAGISITDIKLYFDGVTTLNETVDKRKREILGESGRQSDQYAFCERLAEGLTAGYGGEPDVFAEPEELSARSLGPLAVGIDLGTTTVSAVVLDLASGAQVEVYTLPHQSYLKTGIFSEQSVSQIVQKAERLLQHIVKEYPGVVSVGLTGQMHGILYVDARGRAVSPLINWLDKRGDQPLGEGRSTCEEIRRVTGETVSTGYGLVTHFYNQRHGQIPPEAVGFCSIMDYLGMRLCGRERALTHTSVAASFGLFEVETGAFQRDRLSALAIDPAFLPEVTGENRLIGHWEGIPVAVAIGDNQASFLGSVGDSRESVLVNVGTGAQVSAVIRRPVEARGDLEVRPFLSGHFLICGSTLCGGEAYAMLERFFRDYAIRAGLPDAPQYPVMNALAEAAEAADAALTVDTAFAGKRSDPGHRGSIGPIDRQSFTPGALILGVLDGMAEELCGLYRAFPSKMTRVVASGGAVRRNSVLKRRLEKCFGLPVSVSRIQEEAATGAALFGALCTGRIAYDNGFSDYIHYDE